MKMSLQSFFVFMFSLFFVSASFAAPIDVTATVASITAGITPVTAIGTAVLGVLVTVAVFRWIRKAF